MKVLLHSSPPSLDDKLQKINKTEKLVITFFDILKLSSKFSLDQSTRPASL